MGRGIKIGAALIALVGIAAGVGLIALQDLDRLGGLMLGAGWGIAVVTIAHLVPMAASALAWRAATQPIWRAPYSVYLWGRLVRESLNALLPVLQVGGDFAGARVLVFHNARPVHAVASVLVDVTIEFLTQIVFTAIGLCLLLFKGGGDMVRWGFLGLLISVAAAAGFLIAQRKGLFKLVERLGDILSRQLAWPGLTALATLHDTIGSIYRHRSAVASAMAWHLVSWIVGAIEVWLALRFLDAELSFQSALVIECLGQAVRSAAFFVPGGLGVQEGGFMAVGALFGLGPEVGLSVSLIKRIREIGLGVPALIAWQALEGRRLIGRLDRKADR
jgi:putative membrane protein